MSNEHSVPTLPPALIEAVAAVLRPLARLAVARALPARELEELLRVALVHAAQEAQPGGASSRQVSRIAMATGLTRREVTRLLAGPEAETAPAPRRSPATELFARWISDPTLRSADGQPLELPRQGPAPSFEALAQSVTRDVHPRSLLETLSRLGLAESDEARGTVRLVKDRYVPSTDDERLWNLLGANVADHLAAAVGNVLGDTPRHLEQAVFADGLSESSVAEIRERVGAQWHAVVQALVPEIRRLLDEDRAAGRPATRRIRVGLYNYDANAEARPHADAGAPAAHSARKPGEDDEA